jgi:TRAP-type transport system small permease protein
LIRTTRGEKAGFARRFFMLNKFESWLVAANRWVLILLLAAMACIVFSNVVLRYTTGSSIIWAEEVSRHIMIWTTFLGAGLVLRFGGHVAIDTLHQSVAKSGATVLRAAVVLGVATFCLFMGFYSLDYIEMTQYQTTPATGIPFSYVYAALPVGFALVVLHLVFVAVAYVRSGTFVESGEMSADAAASL